MMGVAVAEEVGAALVVAALMAAVSMVVVLMMRSVDLVEFEVAL